MRALASQIASYLYKGKARRLQNPAPRSNNVKDDLILEEEAERKRRRFLKLLLGVGAIFAGYYSLPYMGDNVMEQSVKLLQVKDPLYKRMGASRLARIAIDDKRRMKIVEKGGAQELVNMLGNAKDERTRKQALKAIDALAISDDAAVALQHLGAISIIKSTPAALEDAELEIYRSRLLKRFQDLRYDVVS